MIAPLPDDQRIVITGVGLDRAERQQSGRVSRRPCWPAGAACGSTKFATSARRWPASARSTRCATRPKKDLRRGTRAGSVGIYCAQRGDRRRRARLGQRRQVAGRRLRRRHRARQRRDRERNLRAQGLRLRHDVLVAPPQPAHGGQQPGRRDGAEPGRHRPALHDRRGLRRGQRRADPGGADAAAGRVRPGPGRRRVGEHSHVRHFRQLQEPGGAGHARRSDEGLAPVRRRPATASSSPKGAACSCWSGCDDARRRGAKIYGELAGYAINTDATDFVLPNPERQAAVHASWPCAAPAWRPSEIDIVSTHATGTGQGDSQECEALRQVFGEQRQDALQQHQELHRPRDGRSRRAGAGRQPAGLSTTASATRQSTSMSSTPSAPCPAWSSISRGNAGREYILNNSFGMLGINSVVIIKRV